MAYKGTTLAVSFQASGFNGNLNQEQLPTSAMVYPSRNVNLHQGGISKRGSTEIIGTRSGSPIITSMYDYVPVSGSHILVYTAFGGGIYKDFTGASIGTGSTTVGAEYEVMNKKLYMAIEAVIPKIWNGADAAVSNLTNLSADFTGTNYPLAFLLHGSGNSERLWALLRTGLYYSDDNDGIADANFASGGQIPLPSDGVGLTACCEWNDKLIAFNNKRAFFINDTDVDDTKWSYTASVWEGGVANQRLLVKTPNDLIAMSEDGEIYSVMKAQQGIGYQAASLTRPSYMHNFIKDFVDLTKIQYFHARYDSTLRAIKFFVTLQSEEFLSSYPTCCLVYFIDSQSWSIHDGTDNKTNSGYGNARCSAVVRSIQYNAAGASDDVDSGYRIYTGDTLGRIWILETEGTVIGNSVSFSDNGNAFWAGFTTPSWNCGNPRIKKSYDSLRLTVNPRENCTLTIDTYIDGVKNFTNNMAITKNTALALFDTEFELGAVGTRSNLQIYNNSASESFFISSLMLDFFNLGAGVLP